MVKHIAYEGLHVSSKGWLESRFHFSFAEYHNPKNMNFGVLRVMNDDIIAPNSGFGTHPHQNMEIFTYVLEGELTHEDSMGNKETLHAGDIQYLSAGSGIYHSEKNDGDAPLRLIQTWIVPNTNGLPPRYGSYKIEKELRHNQWQHLFGAENLGAVIGLYQDANVYAIEQDTATTSEFSLKSGRQAYLKVMEGSIVLNGVSVGFGDSVEIIDEPIIRIEAFLDAHLLLIEMETVYK
ncbi:MAG: pirin family protein [Campylobacteraceae bacterium]|nr:pirin family protein [Campylobacteraceae bacterium]